jgi:hypothetical protein
MDSFEIYGYFVQNELSNKSIREKYAVAKFAESRENEDMRQGLNRLVTSKRPKHN